MTTAVDAPPANWYEDPSGRAQARYWDGRMPVWLGYLGIVTAVVALIGAGATVSTNDTLFTFGFIGFLLAALWILILSVLMLRSAPEAA